MFLYLTQPLMVAQLCYCSYVGKYYSAYSKEFYQEENNPNLKLLSYIVPMPTNLVFLFLSLKYIPKLYVCMHILVCKHTLVLF